MIRTATLPWLVATVYFFCAVEMLHLTLAAQAMQPEPPKQHAHELRHARAIHCLRVILHVYHVAMRVRGVGTNPLHSLVDSRLKRSAQW